MDKKRTCSQRLKAVVEALPLKPGIRVLEIGCGPGAAAREIVKHIGKGYVLAIDRSEKAIAQAVKNSEEEIRSGRLSFRKAAVEDFLLEPDEQPFDIAFAVRVGALDGRHPGKGEQALPKIAGALTENGKLYIDGGNPLREIPITGYR
ncbi:class I SAM-dependent methyltransferase [Sinomicrobium pectinilyticum]|uniref:Class I SAM-dependent methyltransferase n=1 Tax=Sinomicrobium pectinilyticum TaxID=1084421 RepID=A0A3N0EH15_SINP1|nr:class I SAM-dependent methyltransferase [Sinomicrobium pectinilyticum]RNL87132.1 class I SAM-dependent methyltransferase [Sinomicrobium pectinilyticum]